MRAWQVASLALFAIFREQASEIEVAVHSDDIISAAMFATSSTALCP
jgi:hypothetical protein